MAIVRNLFKNQSDNSLIKISMTVLFAVTTFTCICNIYHLVVYLEAQALAFLIFQLLYLITILVSFFEVMQAKETQTFENFTMLTCIYYWSITTTLFLAYFFVETLFRAFISDANTSFIGVFVLYLVDLICSAFLVLLFRDLRDCAQSSASSKNGSDYLEQFDRRLKNTRLSEGKDADLPPSSKRSSIKKTYTISTDKEFVKLNQKGPSGSSGLQNKSNLVNSQEGSVNEKTNNKNLEYSDSIELIE